MECKNCGSSNIEISITCGLEAEVGHVGLNYTKGILGRTAPFYADLCLDCGEVNRIYVKEKELSSLKWIKK